MEAFWKSFDFGAPPVSLNILALVPSHRMFRDSDCGCLKYATVFLGFHCKTECFERKIGSDKDLWIPRCMMAAKFISNADPTGELSLRAHIKSGQIKDSIFSVRSFLLNSGRSNQKHFLCFWLGKLSMGSPPHRDFFSKSP